MENILGSAGKLFRKFKYLIHFRRSRYVSSPVRMPAFVLGILNIKENLMTAADITNLLPMDMDEFLGKYFKLLGQYAASIGLDAQRFSSALTEGVKMCCL